MNHERRIRIFVLIDALGWRLVENREFLTDLLPYRRPLRTVLGFSSGAIPTILTGRPPASNGHWNLFYFDPQGSPFRWLRHFRFLPGRLLNHRVTRKVIKELGQHVFGMGPLFECCVSPQLMPWFNWVEKRPIYEPGGIEGTRSIFDVLATNKIPSRTYTYRHMTDTKILEQAKKDIEQSEATFFFLYLSELDHFLHEYCGDDSKIRSRLAWYESELRKIFETARRMDPELMFSVFSDHGMTPVRKRFDVLGAVNSLGFSMPLDYVAVYDSTMARFWFFNDRARKSIVDRLKSLTHGRVLSDRELDALGILFTDRRYGEVIFLLDAGYLLARSDFHGKGWMPNGMHGYHPDDPDSDAVLLTNRPPSNEARTIADIFSHMMEATT